MATGLIALLDDVAGIAKVAASSLDDVAGQAAKAGAKAAGVVIDDTAVTPRYVVGLAASRELPIVRRIAIGSLKNKLVYLLPAALLLSAVAPWAITPLLMMGGAFLCYEGAEKVHEALWPHDAHQPDPDSSERTLDAAALEEAKVGGAIKTDFILSAEIMAIALATIPESSFWARALILAAVGTGITFGVYGVVALIVKADDAGLALANGRFGGGGLLRAIGRGLVTGMPPFLRVLSTVGTAAMLWVGGGILLHGLESFGYGGLPHALHGLTAAWGSTLEWIATAAVSGLVGLAVGAAIIPLVKHVVAPLATRLRRAPG